MLSTQRHSTSILTRKEILENGFLASSSSHSHSSPVLSYYTDSSSAFKPDTWELPVDLDNTASGSPVCVAKQAESLSSCVKTELHSLTQGISDLSLVCCCKAHRGQATFELSGLPCEHPSRDDCLMNVASQNTSTPCKKDKNPKPLESLLFKSSELVGDTSALGNVPVPGWDISAIKSFMDTSMSLDVSTEELRLLGYPKPDTSSLEAPVVIPLAWPGAFKKHPMLIHMSAAQETRPSDPDAVPVFLHQAL
ncbi:hypothetical protein DUI87_27724 [Hirundo rustica rustica]|uniref:Uncharacterized protein n=1 Tax=Hirundo rustica rustica TaxID=333673 RepID=A0A3M0J9P7_HIRRU|nr:uncharacterized protein LOC120760199 [Hirundo rustica]XP_039936128.1 uncharacterized protein LOC120760199 [Hirundo rustica]XP_039936129.1 uncharacterized protein LOC120760199 [Hirundo rustica]XP_039936130.1 uncharacterized protein LOC120760199 [Hirundo rustica]RMB95613.1 hypothetical protein DUI87_27724 [Hirundo rustica rustica]